METFTIQNLQEPKDISEQLEKLHSAKDKHVRKRIVAELGNARNPAAIESLVKVARDEIPGYWFEDWYVTMHELKREYGDEDEALDKMTLYARRWEDELRTAALDAIRQIGGEQAVKALSEINLENRRIQAQ